MARLKPAQALREALIISEGLMEQPANYRLANMQVVLFSRRAPDKETPNEDTLALIPVGQEGWVAVIADGAGGQRGGNQASSLACQAIIDSVKGVDMDDTRNAVLDGIEQANKNILKLGVGAGSTLALVETRQHVMRPYHVGDSEIFVVGQRGKLKLKTVSHAPAAYAVEAGMIGNEEALLHEERHLVSNLLGFEDMRIELGAVLKLASYDTVLIGSDGLFDNLSQEEIISIIHKGDLRKAMDQLIDACYERMASTDPSTPGKPDDLSIILIRQKAAPRRARKD